VTDVLVPRKFSRAGAVEQSHEAAV
jgi:hypothetical protein